MFHTYRSLLRVRGVRTALGLVFLGALPIGMSGLAILLLVRDRSGSLAAAGAVSAAFGLGNAAGLTVQGWLIDRLGRRRVIASAGAVCASFLVAAVVTTPPGYPLWTSAVGFAVAGVALPAITAAVRAHLPDLVDDGGLRAAAYALLAVLFQTAVVLGPLVVALAVHAAGPGWAVFVAAALTAGAAAWFARLPEGRVRRPDGRAAGGPAADGRARGLRVLLVVAGASGFAHGLTAVGVAAAVTGTPALAGIAFAAAAAGDLCGGFLYGGRRWAASAPSQLVSAQGLAALACAVAGLASASPVWLVPALFLHGLVGAPAAIIVSTVLDDVMPPGAVARGYTRLVGVGLVAGAAGSWFGGLASTRVTAAGLFLAGAAAVAVAAVAALVSRRVFVRAPDTAAG